MSEPWDDPWVNPCTNGGDRLDFGHLGGTVTGGDRDSWYPELWDWLRQSFDVKSMLDVGCGAGYSQRFFHESGVATIGLDCKEVLAYHVMKDPCSVITHDLTQWAWVCEHRLDLVWCCEVVEHIEEKFVQHVVNTLAKNTGKVLAMTAAPRGAGGYHHVNCQDSPYWISLLEAAGLKFRQELTDHARGLCTEAYGRGPNNYFRRSGMVFTVGEAR
jgi:trans-aconitate methyltransferase